MGCVLAPVFAHTASLSWGGIAHSPDSLPFNLSSAVCHFLSVFLFLVFPSIPSLLNSHSTVHKYDTGLSFVFFFLHTEPFSSLVLLELAASFFPGFALYLVLEPLFQYFCISAMHQINGTHFRASWKASTLLHQHSYAADHGKGESGKERSHPAHTNPCQAYSGHGTCVWEDDQGLCTAWGDNFWGQAAEFQYSRTQTVVKNLLWSRWMCVTLQRDQSLRAWWQGVAHFYFSLKVWKP